VQDRESPSAKDRRSTTEPTPPTGDIPVHGRLHENTIQGPCFSSTTPFLSSSECTVCLLHSFVVVFSLFSCIASLTPFTVNRDEHIPTLFLQSNFRVSVRYTAGLGSDIPSKY